MKRDRQIKIDKMRNFFMKLKLKHSGVATLFEE